jgi:hypothetical protein
MKPAKENLRPERIAYLVAAALFLFFLLYSAPHQVHHAFEHSPTTLCLAFAVAKSCHLQLTSVVDFSFTPTASEWIRPSFRVWTPYFIPSPFSQRAPPTV